EKGARTHATCDRHTTETRTRNATLAVRVFATAGRQTRARTPPNETMTAEATNETGAGRAGHIPKTLQLEHEPRKARAMKRQGASRESGVNRTSKAAPFSRASARAVPPWASATARTSASPRPLPRAWPRVV